MKTNQVILIALVMIIGGCSTCIYLRRPYNHKDAYIITKQQSTYLMLSGERVPMAHDPISMIITNTYTDTTLIPLPYVKSMIRGEDIPVKDGEDKYKGTIKIIGHAVKVNLSIGNYDDRTLEPSG